MGVAMLRRLSTLTLFACCFLFVGAPATAETITLKDGRTIQGTVVSRDGNQLVIDSDGIQMSIPADQVSNISFGAAAPAQPAAQAPAAQPQTAKPANVVIPEGTNLTVRLRDTLDTSRNRSGHRFTGVLEGDLVASGVVVASRGSTVYGRVVNASSSGRAVGKASMTLELTELMVNNQLKPIVTTQLNAEGKSTGATTVGRTARGAAIGGLIDGGSGARTGAKVGLGVSLLTRGNDFQIPSGTLLDFRLRTPFHP